MYTVLIVDDEALVRRGITNMIDWESLGFATVLQAEDGLEALEVCRSTKVDLVLTDIVMPFMDGLELSSILNEEFKDIQIVVLTGHEDFEYAKKSVDLGVKNYILKPVGAQTLYTKMKEICAQLRSEDTQKQYIAKMKNQLYNSLPVLREKFLYELVCTESGVVSQAEERIENLELPLFAHSFIVAIVELDLSEITGTDLELLRFSATNIVRECVGRGHSVFADHNRIVIVFNLDYYEEDGHDIVYGTVQVVQKAVFSVLRLVNTGALGTRVKTLAELNQSWRDACSALDCKYSLGNNRVYDIRDLDYIDTVFYYPSEQIKNLTDSIKTMQPAEIKAAVKAVETALEGNLNLSSANIRMVFVEILTSLLRELATVKDVRSELWSEGFCLYSGLETSLSIEQMTDRLLIFSQEVARQLQTTRQNSGELLIRKTKDYLNDNYMDDAITLAQMARQVGVSMGYLSALFKKETGENFTEYLTGVRIENAKKMLRLTDKRTYEIAYETGYTNPHYFSISFKKNTGMSPSEYRNKGRAREELKERS